MNNYSNYWGEPPQIQGRILSHLYVTEQKSLPEIAEIFETYPNKIRREIKRLRAHGIDIPIRGHKEAGQIAYKTGKIPCRDGKKHDVETKMKIGNTIAELWKVDDGSKLEAARKNLAKAHSNSKDPTAVEMKRRRRLLQTTVTGSKLENFLYDGLKNAGYLVEFHKEHFLKQEKLHLDIFLPTIRTAIEVDGPTHHRPIFGEETLAKSKLRDSKKEAFLASKGYFLIRVKQMKKLSMTKMHRALAKVILKLQEIKLMPTGKHQRGQVFFIDAD